MGEKKYIERMGSEEFVKKMYMMELWGQAVEEGRLGDVGTE